MTNLEHVAFAGPGRGMSPAQARGVRRVLSRWTADTATACEFHHRGDLTGLEGAKEAVDAGYWVTSHPAVGDRVAENHLNDTVVPPRAAEDRDAHLIAVCGRVLGAVPGPQFWARVPVWAFLARAHAAGREVAVVDVVVEPPWPNPFAKAWALLVVRCGRSVTTVSEEEALHLRDWLAHHLGGTPAPHEPDRVRAVIDEQMQQLRDRAAGSDSEDFRAGLAWAQNALSKVAEAAGRKRT